MIFIVVAGALLLVAVAIVAIAWPLIREGEDPESVEVLEEIDTVADPLNELKASQQAVYKAIQELRFDFEVGKVSETDYQIFDAQLKGQAVVILKEIDALQADEMDSDLGARLEEEITALRHSNGSGPAKPVSKAAAAASFCPQCGTKVKAGDRFCAKCGTSVAV